MSVSADYTRKALRDLLVQVDLNPQLRRDTSRTGTVDRPLMPEFVSGVVTSLNLGWQDIDQLGVSFNKRYSNRYSFRAAYTWSDGWGNISNNNQSSTFQLLEDLNLDLNEQVPSTVNREHNLVLSGTVDVPKTGGMKVSSIATWTERSDADDLRLEQRPRSERRAHRSAAGGHLLWRPGGRARHAITVENKGGLGGARAPGAFNIDTRFGWKFVLPRGRNLEVYGDFLNMLGTTSFSGYSGDRRTSDFLVATQCGPRSAGPDRRPLRVLDRQHAGWEGRPCRPSHLFPVRPPTSPIQRDLSTAPDPTGGRAPSATCKSQFPVTRSGGQCEMDVRDRRTRHCRMVHLPSIG